jgi:uncharacterized membrane protein YbhN (UPF0104 family)
VKPWLKIAGALVAAAATAYFLWFAWRTVAREDLPALNTGPVLAAVFAAALCYAAVIPISAGAWRLLLRGCRVRAPLLQLNMILGITQIGKYLPGNVGQHLGRAAMSIQRGIPAEALFVTMALETLLAIAAGVVVGAIAVLGAVVGELELPVPLWQATSFATACLLGCLVGVPLCIRLLPALVRRFAPARVSAVAALDRRHFAFARLLALYAVNFVVAGAGLYLVAMALGDAPLHTLPLFVGAFAFAWIAGFIVPGAPAGLGVREGVMTALLAPLLPSAMLLQIVIAFRVASTLGDLLALAWGGALYARYRAE